MEQIFRIHTKFMKQLQFSELLTNVNKEKLLVQLIKLISVNYLK